MKKFVSEAPRIAWLVEPKFDADGVQATSGLDALGREVVDPVPLRPPLDLRVSDGDELQAAIRNILHRERARFAAAVEAEEFESEEDANDFLVAEDMFPLGNEPWEDIHEFPVDDGSGEGRARTPSPPGPQGGEASPPPSGQTVSADQPSESSSSATMAEKPTVGTGEKLQP